MGANFGLNEGQSKDLAMIATGVLKWREVLRCAQDDK